MRRRRLAAVLAAMSGAIALGWAGWAAERSVARRLRAEEAEIVDAGLTFPDDVVNHFITVSDGARLHVVEAGEGPTVVLVHGVTLAASVFAAVMRRTERSMRLIAVDLRGHGASVGGDAGYAFDRQAKDLAELLDALDVRDAVLVGHSMGGMIAQVLMGPMRELVGDRIGSLILLDTSTGPLSASRSGRRTAAMLQAVVQRGLRRSARRGAGVYPGEDAATWLTRASFGRQAAPAQVELARSLTQAMSPVVLAEILEPLMSFDGAAMLSQIEVPTAVIVGSRDLLTPPRQARRLHAGIAGSSILIFDDVGHVPMLECPDQLCAALSLAVHHASR